MYMYLQTNIKVKGKYMQFIGYIYILSGKNNATLNRKPDYTRRLMEQARVICWRGFKIR